MWLRVILFQSVPKYFYEYIILFQTIPMVTFGLGVWQTERLSWKKDLMKKLENKSAEEAVELPYE